MCGGYMWPSDNLIGKYAIFVLIFSSVIIRELELLAMCLLTIYISELFLGIGKGKELSKDVVSAGVWLQPGLTGLLWSMSHTTVSSAWVKGGLFFCTPMPVSHLLGAEDAEWVSYLLRWLPFTEHSSWKGVQLFSHCC